MYRQFTELTFEPFIKGSAGVSQTLSPALAQLLPFTSSSVEPGSLEAIINSPIPYLGPEADNLISFDILFNEILFVS